MKKIPLVLLCFFAAACTQSRLRVYQDALEPMVGTAKKERVDALLGAPVRCEQKTLVESCEYRTSLGRNDPVPISNEKKLGFGPDLSPYEFFDVLQLDYDGFGLLRYWAPVVIKQ